MSALLKNPNFLWSVLVTLALTSVTFGVLRSRVEAHEKRLDKVEAKQIETNEEVLQRLSRIEAKLDRL